MRAQELRNFSEEELTAKLQDLRRELFNLRFQLATGQLKNVKRLKLVKKDIARILTILKENERKTA
jgi:large subunit ribosomal protein L29